MKSLKYRGWQLASSTACCSLSYYCIGVYESKLHKNKITIMEFDLKGLKNALVIIFIQIMNFWIV